MTGLSIERTLELWASSLRDVKSRMRPLFRQDRVAASAGSFIDGILGDERRKTGWMRAEAAGDSGPWRQQAVLGRGNWDADALRDIVRDYALETRPLVGDALEGLCQPRLWTGLYESRQFMQTRMHSELKTVQTV